MQSSTSRSNGDSSQIELQRVVITGLGAISPLGLSVDALWDGVINGRSGIGAITRFDASEFKSQVAGEINDFDPKNYLDRKEARRYDPYIQYTVAAAADAVADSGLKMENEDPHRVGSIVGSAMGGIESLLKNDQVAVKKGMLRVSPFMVPNMLIDSAPGKIAIEHRAYGVNHSVVSACASGTSACGEAFEVIRRGDADIMLTGGSEAPIVQSVFAGFDVMGAMARAKGDPEKASRPFDINRSGFVLSEGAAILVMESEAHAKARGARIYAEVIGYGNRTDAYHMVTPHEEARGASDAIEATLKMASDYGVCASDISYINAHGTSTKLNDRGETLAIKTALGDHARTVAISSTKGVTGHLLGSAGALEAIICAKAIVENMIPPTANLEDADPECDLNYTPQTAVKADVNVALSNSFGFGGHNACIMLRKHEANPKN